MVFNCPFTGKPCADNCALIVLDPADIRVCAITQIAVSLGSIAIYLAR